MTLLHQAAQKAVEASLSAINEAAKVYASGYASPHHITFTVEGLRNLIAALQQQPEPVAPIGWLYDWTHSSALGKPDEQFTGFTTDEAHARKHDNPRAVYTAPALQHQEVPREPVAADAKSILEQVANAPNEENCAMCNGRGFYGIPGQRCSFCKGTGRVQWRSAPDAASPSTTRQQEAGSEPQDCPVCKNGYLASRTDIYKDGREFVYCDCCGCMADRRVWNRIAAAPSTPEKAGGEKACAACKWPLSPCTCPAGVQGTQASSYKLLDHGDVIQRGDEVLADDTVNWLPLVGWEVGMKWGCNFMPMRRPAGVPAAVAPDPGPHIVPTTFPMFASAVARRKWENLQGDGYRMQRIHFARRVDGHERRGTIDPWGKVLWEPDGVQEVVSQTPPPLGTDGGTPQ